MNKNDFTLHVFLHGRDGRVTGKSSQESVRTAQCGPYSHDSLQRLYFRCMISIIICSIDPAKFKRVTEMYNRLMAGHEFEIIGIHDAKGLCEGYTRGLAASHGELVIFSHDDIEFLAPDFAGRLMGHMQFCDMLGLAGTRRMCDVKWPQSGGPYCYGQVAVPIPADKTWTVIIWQAPMRRIDHIQAMDGLFLCAKRPVAQTIGFDAQTFRGFHFYDLDFTFRAHLAGFKLSIANDLYAIHDSTGFPDASWVPDAKRFMEKFGRLMPPLFNRGTRFTMITVPTPKDIVEVMTPPHWNDEP